MHLEDRGVLEPGDRELPRPDGRRCGYTVLASEAEGPNRPRDRGSQVDWLVAKTGYENICRAHTRGRGDRETRWRSVGSHAPAATRRGVMNSTRSSTARIPIPIE